jgi:hypothetical protein
MGQSFEWTRTTRKELPPALRARWSLGLKTPLSAGSYKLGDEIFIGGLPDDSDEFDDSVIAHEVMHYVIAKLSVTDTPGGPHPGHTDPRKAWDEGLATLLGQTALGSPVYSDSTATFTGSWNLDTYDDTNPFVWGTMDATQNGDVHEWLVSLTLWDMMDSDDEPWDHFREESAVLDTVFDFLPDHRTRRRGPRGIDLVDFLDGFRCTLDPRNVAARDSELKLLLDHVIFNYDFLVAGACA